MTPGMQQVGVRNEFFARSAHEIVSHLQNCGAAPGDSYGLKVY